MKKYLSILLAIALLSVPVSSFAEDEESKEETSKSTTVEFLKQDGTLILKDFYPEVNIGAVKLQVLVLTDIVTGRKIGCLRLETRYFSQYTNSTYIGTLDYDELSACIQSMRYIQSQLGSTSPGHYQECEYRSKDGVLLGAFFSDKKNKWEIYVQTKSYTSRSMKFINIDEMDKFISTMEMAKSTIEKAVAE